MVDIIGEGGEKDPRSIPLATKRGSFIPNYRVPEWAPEMHQSAADRFKEERPNAKLRSSSSQYNCVGHAFASRRTWVELDELTRILEEDGYKPLADVKDVWVGDIVVYENNRGDITHVGIVFKKEPDVATASYLVLVLSKWGQPGEYLHEINDVPFPLGRAVSFWTERREA